MGTEWLFLIALPVVAAAIGYVTNRVAIWMLFRPHSEKRLFGLRVPFTPGLIPHRRVEMAERLGTAVAEYLINEASVSARIDTPEVRAAIGESVSDHLDEWLTRELGPVETLIPQPFRDDWEEFLTRLKARVRGELALALRNSATGRFIREQVNAHVGTWLRRPVGELLPEELWEEIPERLGEGLSRLTEDEAFEVRVRAFLEEKIDTALREDAPIGAYLPPRLKEVAYERIEELMPLMLDKISGVLEDERLKKRLKIHLYELADQLVAGAFQEDSMWDQLKFSLLEVFVISTDELKEKIDRTVDEAAPRLAELLRQPDVRRRVHHALTSTIDAFLEKRPSEFDLAPATIEELRERLAGAVVHAARSPRLQEELTTFVHDRLDRWRTQSLGELFPQLSSEALGARIGDHLAEALRQDETINALSQFGCTHVDELVARPLGRLENHIPPEYVAKGKRWLTDETIRVLKQESPKMIQAIDVRGLVREKVGELSIAEVERLILAITSRQLRAIAWFGALLGFLIGLIQVAIVLGRGGF